MTPENRQSWKCDNCWFIQNINENPTQNITTRKKLVINVSTENSYDSLSESFEDSETETTEKLNRSCPELRGTQSEYIAEMKIKIENLERKLKIAENEIENLLTENYKLHSTIEKNGKTIHKLTHICSSDIKKKQRKTLNKTKLNSSQNDSFQENNLDQYSRDSLIATSSGNPETNTSKIDTPDKNQTSIFQLLPKPIPDGATCSEHRIHIFGDEQGGGVCKQLQRIVGEKYKVTSEIKPGATTDKVLESMIPTCSNYDKRDFVMILSGCNDRDPMKLSSYLYYYLSQLSNTNIIILEPPRNLYLNTKQINKVFELVSMQLPYVNYIDLRYTFLGVPRNNLKHMCQNILQEMLRFECRHKLTNKYIHLANKLNRVKEKEIHRDNTQKKTNHLLKNKKQETFFRE